MATILFFRIPYNLRYFNKIWLRYAIFYPKRLYELFENPPFCFQMAAILEKINVIYTQLEGRIESTGFLK